MDKKRVVFGYLFRVANRLQSKMDAQIRDLTAKQWYVLLALGFFEEPPTLKQLAAMCDSTHQNTKQLVMKLRDKGFVNVEADGKDGRAMRIIPTAKIDEWDAENEAMAQDFIARMFTGFDEKETAALCGSLIKLFDNVNNINGGEVNE